MPIRPYSPYGAGVPKSRVPKVLATGNKPQPKPKRAKLKKFTPDSLPFYKGQIAKQSLFGAVSGIRPRRKKPVTYVT